MLAAIWDAASMGGDIEISDGGLVDDATLRTAILVSLFTDRRAETDDELPDSTTADRRGWLGDALALDNDRIGSRLWLLKRRKQTEETRLLAEEYCREALAWLVNDGIATSLTVEAAWIASGYLAAQINVILSDGSAVAFNYSVETASV